MKVILFMAQTVNGMIARENFQEDFLSHKNWKTFSTLAESIGCFIVGRKTEEQVQQWKEYNFNNINAKRIIISKKSILNSNKKVTYAKSPQDALNKAAKWGFKTVLLTGGSQINSAFIKKNLIDEVIINVEPYILGKGIPLFAKDRFEKKLKLKQIKRLNLNIIQLRYKAK